MKYAYDAGGRLTTIIDSLSGMISRSYDILNRLSNETTSAGSLAYAYDAIGRRTKMTVAGQPEVNYGYDTNSRLTAVAVPGLVPARISYDALGRRASLTSPNGVMTNYTYDNASRLLNLEHLNPLNEILEKISYAYDANGNRTSMDRLNMPVKLPNPASNITYNSANQQITFSDKNITYDDNGNMITVTTSCGTTTYTWDARNRLVGINGFTSTSTCSPLTALFKYDALGRRIEKTVNGKTVNYLYDGLDIVQGIEDGTVTANYFRTLNIDEPLARVKSDGTVRFYQQDALGSVIALTDETGTIRTQYNYDPFGNTELIGEESDNPFQYTGRENDGTGLYGYRFRYYSPELQRFISEDPIGLAGGDVNIYAYVGNSPVNFVDPWGLEARSPKNNYGSISKPPSLDRRILDELYTDYYSLFNDGPRERIDVLMEYEKLILDIVVLRMTAGEFFVKDLPHKGLGPHIHYGPKYPNSAHPKFHFGPKDPNFGRGPFTWGDWFKAGMPWRWK